MKTKTYAKVSCIICLSSALIALAVLCWSPADITYAWASNILHSSDTLAEMISSQYGTWPIVMAAIVAFWIESGYWVLGLVGLLFGLAAFLSYILYKRSGYTG